MTSARRTKTLPIAAPPERKPREVVPLSERLLWGIDDVAGALGVSRPTFERLRSSGRFPKPDLLIGKRPMWRRATVEKWVEHSAGDD
jgi:predicted DNA-binding transcriptional regulator AlpA